MIPYGPYEPDKAQLDTGLTAVVTNTRPGPNCFYPLPSLSAFSSAALAGGQCYGGTSVRAADGTVRIFAGTASTLEELNATDLSWDDRSKAGGYTLVAGETWWFQRFGNLLICGSGGPSIQSVNIDSGTTFADLSGSPPKARYAKTIGPHLMLASLASNPDTVQACAAADATNWNTGGGSNGISQQFQNGGHVQGITSGRLVGYIFQEDAVRRASLTQDNNIFQFDLVADGLGLSAPASLVQTVGQMFFLDRNGFVAFDGQGFRRIGEGRVDQTFLTDADSTAITQVWGAVDPKETEVYWFYTSSDNASNYNDKVLIYNYALDRWAMGEVSVAVAFPAIPTGTTLENIDTLFPSYNLDTLPWSLDDRIFQGTLPSLAAFGSDDKLSFFTGSNLAVTIETAEAQPIQGRRAFIQGVTPIFEGTSTAITVAVGTKERPSDTLSFGSDIAMGITGECPQRRSGRYARARTKGPAGEDWSKMHGFDYRAVPDGMR